MSSRLFPRKKASTCTRKHSGGNFTSNSRSTKMLVMMKRNVTPLCDRHHKPMQLAQFGASNIALNFVAHRCMVESCSRVYQHGHGYIDVTDVISFEQNTRA